MDTCTKCNLKVGPHQFGIECDECSKWTHISCGTGYTKKTYIEAVKGMYISNSVILFDSENSNSTVMHVKW